MPTPTVVFVPTPTPTAPTSPSQPDHVRRGLAALEQIPYSPAAIGYTVNFFAGREGYLGLTFVDRQSIEVYVRPSMSDADLRYVIAHELGHAIDASLTSYEDRSRWFAARGIAPSTPWWPTTMGSDLATPAGDFAECFAAWAVGSPSHSHFGSCSGTGPLIAEMIRG